MRPAWLVSTFAVFGALPACDDESYLVVTVEARPAVADATTLRVSLTNAGTTRTDEIPLGTSTFPVTFSVSAPGRAGDLRIEVEALDADALLVGRGGHDSSVEAEAASVRLDPTDFVVNTEVAEDQFPSDDFEAHGYQVASAPNGTWTVAYRDRCSAPCNMFARRFDANGRAVTTRIAANTNGFPVSTNLTTFASTPAIATSISNTTLAVWDFRDPQNSATAGIACRSLDAMGGASPDQRSLALDASSDVVSIAPLANSNFVVTWNAFISTSVIRSVIVRPDCTTLSGAASVSTTNISRRASVASNGTPGNIMYAWLVSGNLHVRIANNTNTFTAPMDALFLPKTATEAIEAVRVAPLGAGFGLLVRWAQATGNSGPGRIDLIRTTLTGDVIGAPVTVTTRTGTDFGSTEAFGVATGPSGTLLVVWHSCLENGDGNGCGVFARALGADGTPAGDEFVVATTITGDQTNPSVAALPDDAFAVVWKDDSGAPPDTSGSAVRARIVYPVGVTSPN